MSDRASDGRSAQSSVGQSHQGREPGAPAERDPDGIAPPVTDQPTVITSAPVVSTSPQGALDTDLRTTDIPPGARLGHFELLEYIGGGGMGRVYRALDTRLGRTVALKVLSRDQASELDTLMRFRNEAQSAARLNHESIAQVYYLGEDSGLPFIAFEFIQGINVRDLIVQDGPLPLAKALSLTVQVAEALAHAADRAVVHRDIKPSNVLITSGGRVKLIDMGLARMQKVGTSAEDLTASGVTLGTFDYISPEQARDPRNADVRSDIYSLGCTLFYMLTGRPPFPEGTVLQKLLQHQGIEPPDIRQFRPDLPEEVSRVLRKMMAKEPRRRYQDSPELIDALLLLAEQMGVRSVGPGNSKWIAMEEPKGSLLRRHVPWLAPVAALLLLVLLLNLLWDRMAGDDGQAPSWGSPMEPSATERSGAEGSPQPPDGASEVKTPVSDPRGPSAARAGSPSSAQTPLTPRDTGSGPEKPAPAPVDGVGPQPMEQPADNVPAAAAGSNPLHSMLASRSARDRVGPDVLRGGVSLPERSSAGLSVAPQTVLPVEGRKQPRTTPSGPTGAGSPAETAFSPSGVLVVDPNGELQGSFATLADACSAAGQTAVIELHCDGRFEESPLRLADRDLTIRAAEGYRPILGFRPSEVDPVRSPSTMVTLAQSRLTLVDVSVEFDVPREVSPRSWALLEIGEADRVTLERCTLTIRNASDQRTAYHQEVAFFRLSASPVVGVVRRNETAEVAPPVAVELADCVVRGEAVFLRVAGPRAVELTFRRGFLITTEQLLLADGLEETPHPNEVVRIELSNLAAVVDAGLCRFDSSELEPYQLAAHVDCVDSVLVGTPKASLIEQVGVTDREQSLQRIHWRGGHNSYEGFTGFWTMRYLDSDAPPEVKTFDEWRSWWGAESEASPTSGMTHQGDLPGPERPVHSLSPADYPWTTALTNRRPASEGEGEPNQPDAGPRPKTDASPQPPGQAATVPMPDASSAP